jgi:hypothetical protein
MRKPVMMRVKVEDDLRCRFQGAAYRAHHYPSQVMRLLMEKYVELEQDPYAVDLTLWSNNVLRAAHAVTQAMPLMPEVRIYEDDDEVIRARKEGWASPGFGRW